MLLQGNAITPVDWWSTQWVQDRVLRKLVEAGVPFVEIGQDNYDSHADNFVCHKANMQVLDPAWSGLLIDLERTGLLQDTLVVWMGEVGRTPTINNRAGRDHFIRGWTVVLAGGGIKGGVVYGSTDADGREVAHHQTGQWVNALPTVLADGRVVVGGFDGLARVFDPDGRELGSYRAKGWLASSGTQLPSGTLVVGDVTDLAVGQVVVGTGISTIGKTGCPVRRSSM